MSRISTFVSASTCCKVLADTAVKSDGCAIDIVEEDEDALADGRGDMGFIDKRDRGVAGVEDG